MERHSLDPYPIPKDKSSLYINEPWLIDTTLLDEPPLSKEPENQEDNIRVYIPLDLNRAAILRRLDSIISRHGEACEENEMDFSLEVERLLSQVEIYDQIWGVRHWDGERDHSKEAEELVNEIIARLDV